MSFLKQTLASLLGSIVAFIIGILILVGIIAGSISALGSSNDEEETYDKALLKLSFRDPIVEYHEEGVLDGLDLPIGSKESKISLKDIKSGIQKAAKDPKIGGILLDLSDVEASFATIREIRFALNDFKKSGKKIYCYAETMSEKAYYLASESNAIYMVPEGILEFNGLISERMYYKGLFKKLGVEPHLFRVGKFKSAGEPFIRESMSDSDRVQTKSYLESIYKTVINDIASSRKINPTTLRSISDELKVQQTEDAVKLGLIDGIKYYDEVIDLVKKDLKMKSTETLHLCRSEYYEPTEEEKLEEESYRGNEIAVMVAEGEIVDGRSDDDQVGSIDFCSTLRKLRADNNIKAIVLRINSPGGSAIASDVMWREVIATSKVKPIVASISGLGASGGYYIAMACNQIMVQPNTITGSIGVFGLWANLSPFLKDKLGITFDRVSTGNYSGLGYPTKPLSEKDSLVIQNGVNRIYKQFITKAAQGRKMSYEELDKLASGRVWTGEQAVKNGLADKIGTLEDAIKMVSQQAKISDYKVTYYPKKDGVWKDKVKLEKSVKLDLGPLEPYYSDLKKLEKIQGIQTRLPFELKIY